MRTSAARFHEHISDQLRRLRFRPSKADPDLCFKQNGESYEYVNTHVDDVMSFCKDPMAYINKLKEIYILKGVGSSRYYLGGGVEVLGGKWKNIGVTTALSAKTYIDNVLVKLEQMMSTTFTRANTPMSTTHYPELDTSEFLDDKAASKYRALIGSANWIIALGRFDINYATQVLSRFSIKPWAGHLRAAMRIFSFFDEFAREDESLTPINSTHPKSALNHIPIGVNFIRMLKRNY